MAGLLKTSGQEFKIIRINMLRGLMGKVDSMQEQMDTVRRELEILRKNHKDMPELKSTVTEMKSTFDGLISRLDMAEERTSELEGISRESLKTGKQREQRLSQNRISKNCKATTKGVTYVGMPEGEERERRNI